MTTQTKGAAPAGIAFRTAVQTHDETVTDQTVTMTTATQDLTPLQVPVSGFIRRVWYVITCTTSGNSANVAFKEDGPWSAIDTITYEDVNQAPIIGPLSGFDLYLINKYGGYAFREDPKDSPIYYATTSTGGTGGSFQFALMLPIELVGRDALGPLANKSGSAQYKVRIRLAPSTNVYSTAPTALGSVRVIGVTESYWDPEPADLKGRPINQQPPALGTTQYWTVQSFDFTAGNFRKSSERVGYLLRNLLFVARASDGTRATMDPLWPDPFSIQVDATIWRARNKPLWRHQMARDYGIAGTTAEAAGAYSNAVFVENLVSDFGLHPGAETRRGYLETSAATRLDFYGSTTGSGSQNLRVLTNDVAPIGDYLQLTA